MTRIVLSLVSLALCAGFVPLSGWLTDRREIMLLYGIAMTGIPFMLALIGTFPEWMPGGFWSGALRALGVVYAVLFAGLILTAPHFSAEELKYPFAASLGMMAIISLGHLVVGVVRVRKTSDK